MTDRQTITRNRYGAISPEPVKYRAIVLDAQVQGLIEAEGCEFDSRRRGWALNYDIYDIDIPSRRMIVQRRYTVGDKYGLHPTKTYLLISWFRGRATTVEVAPAKALIAKLAKVATRLGQVVARVCDGDTSVKLPSASIPRQAYKQLAVVDGQLRSIFSGRPYTIGGTYRESVRSHHGGGYYWYADKHAASAASVPSASKLLDAPRVVVRLRVAGGVRSYGGGKYASSRMTIMEVMEVCDTPGV